MRILLVADLHYALPQLDWVVAAAPEFDLVVLAGDHLDVASSVPLEAQCLVIEKYVALLAATTTTVVSSGNHDLTGPDAAGEQAPLWFEHLRQPGVHLDGASIDLGDTLITVCPWWEGDVGKAALAEQFRRDAVRRPRHWIWVYHWPPIDSTTSWTGKRHYGDPDLAGWIDEFRPDFVLTGHVHESPFKPDGGWIDRVGSTWVLNAGRQIGPVPARIEIDLEGGEAAWLTMLGVETQQLDDHTVAPRSVF